MLASLISGRFTAIRTGRLEAMVSAARAADPEDKETSKLIAVHLGDEYLKIGTRRSRKILTTRRSGSCRIIITLWQEKGASGINRRLRNAVKFLTESTSRPRCREKRTLLGDIFTKSENPMKQPNNMIWRNLSNSNSATKTSDGWRFCG